ncbi:MAG: hypothetical protein ACE5OZ_05785 [Candidatus Heimdallarchaeota archaeon]
MKALINLTPWESKRLIARGLAADADVEQCMENGRIVVARGIHCGYVLEELTGKPIEKNKFVAGMITEPLEKRLGATNPAIRLSEVMIENGVPKDVQITPELIVSLEKDDIIVKSANALDSDYIPAILASHPNGGTYGAFWSTALARGIKVVCPVSLERLVIDSVLESASTMGITQIDLSMGAKCGLLAMPSAFAFTEIDAMETLFPEIVANHVASGGLGRGGEGSVTLLLEGTEEEVRAAFELVLQLAAEEDPLDPL